MSPIKSLLLLLIFAVFLPTFSRGIATAHGAAGALAACARIDDGLPDVPASALPPDFLAASGEHMIRCEATVHGWVPLGCDLGIFCGEIVKAWEHSLIGTVWTAAITLGASGDDGLVFVAFVADPPDFLIAGWGDLVWPQRAILRRVPLTSELGILAGEIVFAGDDFFAGADRAACAMVAAGNVGLPFMAVLADPPHLAATAGEHIARCQIAIFRRMPLAGELGIDRRQIVHASEHHAIGANRTAGTADTRFYLRLPFVAVLADPPHWAVAARQHV